MTKSKARRREATGRHMRAATLRSTSYNADDRTIEVVWTTGARVSRSDWDGDFDEVLSLDPNAVRLDRLNAGAPFLNTHSSWSLSDVIGSIVPGSARIEGGKGVATIQLSGGAADADTVGKIRDGVIRNISVGYLVHGYQDTEKDGITTRTVTDWEPLEISAVPIPADAGAQIRSHSGVSPTGAHKPPISRRVADIRRWARKVGLPALGAQHVRLGTSADDFFTIITAHLTGRSSEEAETMADHKNQIREYDAGRRAAEKLLGRKSGRDDEDTKTGDEIDDEDDDGTCPTCGRPNDDDSRDDDSDDEMDADTGDEDEDDAGDKKDNKRDAPWSKPVTSAALRRGAKAARQAMTRR